MLLLSAVIVRKAMARFFSLRPLNLPFSTKRAETCYVSFIAFVLFALMLFSMVPHASLAAPQPAAKPAAKAQPEKAAKPLRILVLGDSLADGIWAGLYWESRRSGQFEALRFAKNGTGLSRADYYNWEQKAKSLINAQKPDAVVMMVGINDRQALYATDNKKRYRFRSEEWLKRYKARVRAVMRHSQNKKIPLFWIGLPIMRDQNMRKDAEYFNAIYKEAATEFANIFYVPLWNVTLDENGQYSSYRRTTAGKVKKFRASDGIHFTMSGYSILATHITASLTANIPTLRTDALQIAATDSEETAKTRPPKRPSEPASQKQPEAKQTAAQTGQKTSPETKPAQKTETAPQAPITAAMEDRWQGVRSMLQAETAVKPNTPPQKTLTVGVMPAGIKDSLADARLSIRDSSKAAIEVLDSLVGEFEARDAVIARCENRINELVTEASVKMGALSKLLDDVDRLKNELSEKDKKIKMLEQQLAKTSNTQTPAVAQ